MTTYFNDKDKQGKGTCGCNREHKTTDAYNDKYMNNHDQHEGETCREGEVCNKSDDYKTGDNMNAKPGFNATDKTTDDMDFRSDYNNYDRKG